MSKKQDVEWVGVCELKIHSEKRTPRLHGKTILISGGSTASTAAPIIAGAMTGAAIGSMLGD